MRKAASAALVLALAFGASCAEPLPVAQVSPVFSATPSPSPTPSAPSSATAARTTPPMPSASTGVRTVAAGAVPSAPRLIEVGRGSSLIVRLWLVDLAAGRPAVMIAEWQNAIAIFADMSATPDARVVAITAPSTRSASALYVLTTATGALELVFEDPDFAAVEPQLSPDGTKIAFNELGKAGTAGADRGVWLYDRAAKTTTRIAAPEGTSGFSVTARGWSPDGRWLAVYRRTAPTIRLVPSAGGSEIPVGDGDLVAWRSRAPELLLGSVVAGGQMIRIATYDIAAKALREVHRAERSILRDLQWHPTADTFVYGQDQPGIVPPAIPAYEVWQRNADGSQPSLIERSTRGVTTPEWSSDGSILSGYQADGPNTIAVFAYPSGRPIATLCRGGGTPPSCR